MMSSKSTITVLAILFFSSLLVSQVPQYRDGIVYAKVKESINEQFSDGQFVALLESNDIISYKCLLSKFKKAYPNKNSETYHDLCSTYELYFSNELAVENQVGRLMNTGLFEVVEPAFIFQTLFNDVQPNDPFADSTLIGSSGMPQLTLHDFYKAWSVQKGDTNVVIGVVDTGINFDQEDLKGNLSLNYNDPIDGVNNDGDVLDGDSLLEDIPLVDNFRGWDLGDNDNDPSEPAGAKHGTEMASIIAATPDNDTGMVGVAYNCKYLPIKASRDANPNALNQGYVGMIYAAEQGAKVVNCSWGTTNQLPEIFQLLTSALTFDYDIVIVSAAGNENNEKNYYPASFPHVVSVSGMDYDSSKTASSSYNYEVDLMAAGFTRVANGDQTSSYRVENGTSGATAVVSGLVGLVRSQLPELNAIQVKKHLEVTSDLVDTMASILPYAHKVGRRINPYNSLVDTLKPGLEPFNFSVNNGEVKVNNQGDLVSLTLDVVNLLKPSGNVDYKITALTDNFSFIDDAGVLPSMNTWDTLTVQDNINLEIFPTTDTLIDCVLLIEFSDDNGYRDRAIHRFKLKPTDVTSLADASKNRFRIEVFPNPITSSFTLSTDLNVQTIKYFNLSGEELTIDFTNKDQVFNIEPKQTLFEGVYFLEITSDEGVYLKKIIKKTP